MAYSCCFAAYPKVNLQVSASAKLPVADLEGDCHLVVLVQLLVEAFALMRLHLDVVRRGEGEQAARRCEKTKGREQHLCGGRAWPICCCEGMLLGIHKQTPEMRCGHVLNCWCILSHSKATPHQPQETHQ